MKPHVWPWSFRASRLALEDIRCEGANLCIDREA